MVKLSTHCVCPFHGLLAPCGGGGYELFTPPVSIARSLRYSLTTPPIYCVCDDWFWGVGYHLSAWRCPRLSPLLQPPLHLRLSRVSTQSLRFPSSLPTIFRAFGCGQWFALPMRSACDVVRSVSSLRGSPIRRSCTGSHAFLAAVRLNFARDQISLSFHLTHEPFASGYKTPTPFDKCRTTKCYGVVTMGRRSAGLWLHGSAAVVGEILKFVWWLQKGGRVKDTIVAVRVHPRFRACLTKSSRPVPRPWSPEENHVRAKAEADLKSARTWATLGLRVTAISFCLNGLARTFGFSRPFAIRDQIEDLMRQIDPDGRIRESLRNT